MRALAEDVATRMSRADLVLRLPCCSPAGSGGGAGMEEEEEEEEEEEGREADGHDPGASAPKSTHYDGRSGSSGDRDAGLVAVSPQNALIACRQAHVIAGVYGLTDLKESSIQEQLKWIKIVGFASKGKWQFATAM